MRARDFFPPRGSFAKRPQLPPARRLAAVAPVPPPAPELPRASVEEYRRAAAEPPRPAPRFTPKDAARETGPIEGLFVMAAVSAGTGEEGPVRVVASTTDPAAAAQAARALRDLDWDRLDAAKAKPGLTYAAARETAARRAPQVLPPLPEDAEILEPAFGNWLAKGWPPFEAGNPSAEAVAARNALMSLTYPGTFRGHSYRSGPGNFSDYRSLLAQVDQLTGVHGTSRWPLAALPAADERWGIALDAVDGAAEALRHADPERSHAYARLRACMSAAPDCETALRLARLSAEAGLTGYLCLSPAGPARRGAA